MNCYYHVEVPAVAQCSQCGKFLCRECVDRHYPTAICDNCFNYNEYSKEQSEKNLYSLSKKIFIACFVFFFIAGILYSIIHRCIDLMFPIELLISSVAAAGIPYGWKKLQMKPDTFLVLPIFGWVIYFFIKFAIANMIGWIFFLPELIKDIQEHLNKKV